MEYTDILEFEMRPDKKCINNLKTVIDICTSGLTGNKKMYGVIGKNGPFEICHHEIVKPRFLHIKMATLSYFHQNDHEKIL